MKWTKGGVKRLDRPFGFLVTFMYVYLKFIMKI